MLLSPNNVVDSFPVPGLFSYALSTKIYRNPLLKKEEGEDKIKEG